LKISIITVCLNSAATMRDAIESVLSQTYEDVEYIVVDGGSTDRTMSIVREYEGRIAKIVSEPDKGIYDAMNKGIRLATGDVVGILNSDDFFEDPRVLQDVAASFKSQSATDVVFGDVVFVRPGDLSEVVRFYGASHFEPWKLRFGWMPPHPATFIRRRVYEKAGLYETSYKIAADYEMFVRLLLVRKVTFARINRVLVRMRSGGTSTAGVRSSIQLNTEIVRACKENGIYTNLPMVLTKVPFKLRELFKRPRAA
jgi:glycosyltransferase involved in cell wall biosynthesis